MGLHVTPYGTFYVQRSLRTGEVMQVLPVKRPDMPSHLPSVNSLGITENFIESRRASLAADTARASDSQGRLQQELATAGGESLLATGKAALAQTGDVGASSSSNQGSISHSSPMAQNYDDDVEMVHGSSTAGSAVALPTSPVSYHHSHSSSGQSRSDSHRGSNMNYILSEDPNQPPSSMVMAPHMLPVRPWPDAHQESTVNLPSFREIDSARALTHEEELRREEQISSSGRHGSRWKATSSPCMSSLLRSSSRNSNHSNSTSSMCHGHNNNNSIISNSSNAFSINNMISHGSEGSVSSAYSVSEASTPSAFSPGPEYYYCNSNSSYSPAATCAAVSPAMDPISGGAGCSMAIDGASSPQVPSADSYRSSNKSTPRASRVNRTRTSPSPRPPPAAVSSAPSAPFPLAAPLAPSPLSATPQKKNKTVWIIRTLEPRKATSRRTANGEQDYDDYEPQRVQTHVETHIVP